MNNNVIQSLLYKIDNISNKISNLQMKYQLNEIENKNDF